MKGIVASVARLGLITMLIAAVCLPAAAEVLWYNGDYQDTGGASGVINVIQPESHYALYDDFNVPGDGWTITTVWSNNIIDYSFTQAHWEIRAGVSTGNGGTLVAGGTDTATLTPTGRFINTAEYTIEVSGLNVSLPSGTYWLSVVPISPSTDNNAWLSITYGKNAVGQPPGNNGNFFMDVKIRDLPPIVFGGPGSYDFSMGVGGNLGIVPLPGALLPLGAGLGCLAIYRRRKRNTKN